MKILRRSARLVCIALALPAAAAAPPSKVPPPFQLDDLRQLVSLGEPRISPDGGRVAVVVSTPVWASDKTREQIVLVDVATGRWRAATWHRSDLGALHWSHDGTRLGFIAKDSLADPTAAPADADAGDEDGPQGQVFVMPMAGGDPQRITDAPRGVEEFAWSPDDSRIAFLTADEAPDAAAIAAHDDAFEVTDNHFLTRKALTPWHLWVVPSEGGEARRLTEGSFSLQTDQQDAAPRPEWSPDGRSIAYTRFPGPYWGPSFQSVVEVVDAAGGAPRPLVTAQGASDPRYAPGGDRYAFLRPRGGDQNNGNAVYVGGAGSDRDATAALARNVDAWAWLPGDGGLLLAGADGTRRALWRQPLDGAARRLELGEVQAQPEMSVAPTGAIAFVGSTATHPDELYVLDGVDGAPRRLTDLNAFVDRLSLGRTEPVEWDGPDGFREDGVLTYPVGYREGTRAPLVLVIHGGPEAASTVAFSPLPQLLSAAGFLVFQPNYRGSTNRGDAYQHAIRRDTVAGPGEDVMAGLAAVEKLGVVDPDRIGVSGWSYGGTMTAWLTAHHQVWKAAVVGAPLTDWVMDYTLAYYQSGDLYFFGGSPWTAEYERIWREQSPIAYARNVTAPSLILGDVGDSNVPLLNAYEWYHALRDNGVPVRFFAYPVDSHFPHDIVRRTDVYRRWVDWMTTHLD